MLVVRAATKSPASSKNAKALTDDAELCDAASTRLTGTNSWPLSCASLPFVPIAETLFGMILCTFIKFESFNLIRFSSLLQGIRQARLSVSR